MTGAMPVIRRVGRARRFTVRVRLEGEVVSWSADNYADIGVLSEVFGQTVYALADGLAPATILDVGSHVGASVLYFSRRYPSATIIAVEADPSNFVKLTRNVGHLPNVRLVQAAAASQAGLVTLFSSGQTDSWKSSTRRTTAWQRPVEVRAVRLDDLLAKHRAREPLLMKIDIEGAEHEVLSSFHGLGRVAAIVGELHPHLIPVPVAEFRSLFAGFDLDLPEEIEHDTTFRARRVSSRACQLAQAMKWRSSSCGGHERR